jgi:hypothetical protein
MSCSQLTSRFTFDDSIVFALTTSVAEEDKYYYPTQRLLADIQFSDVKFYMPMTSLTCRDVTITGFNNIACLVGWWNQRSKSSQFHSSYTLDSLGLVEFLCSGGPV